MQRQIFLFYIVSVLTRRERGEGRGRGGGGGGGGGGAEEGGAGKKYRGPAVGKGDRRPTILYMFCLVQANPFRPSPSHSATKSLSFRFSVKTFSRFTLAAGAQKHFFAGGPNQLRRPGLNVITLKQKQLNNSIE